ncbi:hypothetical protein CsSME_00006212 [Camellia sinensis var. sinensis]
MYLPLDHCLSGGSLAWILGWDSLDTVIAAETLGLTLQSLGNLGDAKDLLERCLEARKTILLEDHIQGLLPSGLVDRRSWIHVSSAVTREHKTHVPMNPGLRAPCYYSHGGAGGGLLEGFKVVVGVLRLAAILGCRVSVASFIFGLAFGSTLKASSM